VQLVSFLWVLSPFFTAVRKMNGSRRLAFSLTHDVHRLSTVIVISFYADRHFHIAARRHEGGCAASQPLPHFTLHAMHGGAAQHESQRPRGRDKLIGLHASAL